MGLLTNAGPPPWHPATAPLRVGGSPYLSLFWVQLIAAVRIGLEIVASQ